MLRCGVLWPIVTATTDADRAGRFFGMVCGWRGGAAVCLLARVVPSVIGPHCASCDGAARPVLLDAAVPEMSVRVIHGDMLVELPKLIAAGERFHASVTDPPYEIGFMSRRWDKTGVAFRPETWRLVFDALLPGAHMFCFGGTRTWHRVACAIEDAGFEMRDTLCWLYGSGFPKSLNVERAISTTTCTLQGRHFAATLPKADERQCGDHICPTTPEAAPWDGYGTALKPAFEPIILARKPLGERTVATNVLRYGTGALNVDASRIATAEDLDGGAYAKEGGRCVSPSCNDGSGMNVPGKTTGREFVQPLGRWPANVLHDGSDEVVAAFPDAPGQQAALTGNEPTKDGFSGSVYGKAKGRVGGYEPRGDSGSAARFFYTAKADSDDRAGSKHPTVKPTDLIRYLVRLITPPGGCVLDCFAGTGTTGLAADQLGFDAVLIERDARYAADARRKIESDAPLLVRVAAE